MKKNNFALFASPGLSSFFPVYMHDRLLSRLLPTYGVFYISSLSTVVPPEVGQTHQQGDRFFLFDRRLQVDLRSPLLAEDWSCIRRVFETPRGVHMGQTFLRDFIAALGSWNLNGGNI
jgi:hypothetical protein